MLIPRVCVIPSLLQLDIFTGFLVPASPYRLDDGHDEQHHDHD